MLVPKHNDGCLQWAKELGVPGLQLALGEETRSGVET